MGTLKNHAINPRALFRVVFILSLSLLLVSCQGGGDGRSAPGFAGETHGSGVGKVLARFLVLDYKAKPAPGVRLSNEAALEVVLTDSNGRGELHYFNPGAIDVWVTPVGANQAQRISLGDLNGEPIESIYTTLSIDANGVVSVGAIEAFQNDSKDPISDSDVKKKDQPKPKNENNNFVPTDPEPTPPAPTPTSTPSSESSSGLGPVPSPDTKPNRGPVGGSSSSASSSSSSIDRGADDGTSTIQPIK